MCVQHKLEYVDRDEVIAGHVSSTFHQICTLEEIQEVFWPIYIYIFTGSNLYHVFKSTKILRLRRMLNYYIK